jgi:hypothetical protein
VILSGPVQYLFCLGWLTWFVAAASPVGVVVLGTTLVMLVLHAHRLLPIAATSKCIVGDLAAGSWIIIEQTRLMPLQRIVEAASG